ncbi:MAG: DUF3971 domain-containing protein [Pseudomonadota bacterium]
MSTDQHSFEESLPARGLHALAPWAWRLLVGSVVLLAVYVAVGRYSMAQLPALRDPILAQLNARLPFSVSAEHLSGGWQAFSPELALSALRIEQPEGDVPPIALRSGRMRIDIPGSLSSRSLQLSRLEVSGLELDARLNDDGTIEIIGFASGGGAFTDWLENFLPNVERITLTDNVLRLRTPSGANTAVTLNLSFERQGNSRVVQGTAVAEGLALAVNADGVGNPLKPLSWSGDIFVDAESSDLGSLASLWESLDWPFTLAGQASVQFWLKREEGDSTASLHFDSRSVQVEERTGAWQLPLDALTFDAALDQRARHWSLLTEDFHAEREGQVLDLDRAQFDWWGQSVRVRATDLSLDALPTIFASAPGLPEGLREVLPTLAPVGDLPSIELRLDDLSAPAESWALRAAIEGVGFSSWRNAPALTGVTGYLELAPGGGELQLDSSEFSMHYPSVYTEPMTYDDALGSLHFFWDKEGLQLGSDLLELAGVEGNTRGLLAIDIPFEQRVTAVELELLIGLQDSGVEYREKYLPYRLPQTLLSWLDRSMQAGEISKAGFIWRGSVKPKNFPHVTVQLFLDTQDATLKYDPAWPELEDLSAQVWLDDNRVWARSDRGTSVGAQLSDVMVSVLPISGGVNLRVAGDVAADGETAGYLLAETPLREVTNEVFASWDLTGDVAGSLSLSLDIDQSKRPPLVDLDLSLDNVSVHVSQVDLPLDEVKGALRYHSHRGFVGSAITANALGGVLAITERDPIDADSGAMIKDDGGVESIGEADSVDHGGLDALQTAERDGPNARGIATIDITGDVDAAGIAQWLDLSLLDFATGNTEVAGTLTVTDAGAHFSLESALEGIAFDAPRPFGKDATQALTLRLDVPLGEDPLLSMSLGERLRFTLDFDGNEMSQLVAAVGGGSPDGAACDQRYCLSGTVSHLDYSAWDAFYDRYLSESPVDAAVADPSLQVAGGPASEVTSADADITPDVGGVRPAESAATQPAFSYRIDSLSVGELRVGDRSLGEARVDLWGEEELWQGALESSLLQGSLTRENEELQLLIEYLALDRLGDESGEPIIVTDLRTWLPSMRVDVLEIRSGETLIGNLGFDLDMSHPDGALYASGIAGNAYGLNLSDPTGGLLRWSDAGSGEALTELELDVSFADFGNVLSAAGYAPTIESEDGGASLRIAWPGDPTDYAMAKSEGSLALTASNGRLFESRPGALALISFLNLAEILRGLSLTHMFEAGIPFLTAETELHLHRGMLEVTRLQIDGAASAFAFNGLSNLDEGSIDGELVVTLPVANNLPWVAALAAGLPVAAGVFVVSKVFEKQVNRMSSAVYGVSGAIEDPEVEFRRLFDDQLTPTAQAPEDSGTGDD